MSEPNIGDKVSIRLHYRANGKVGGWTPVDRTGTVVKVNKVTAVVACIGRKVLETVRFDRITILEGAPPLRPQCAICQSSLKVAGPPNIVEPQANPCFVPPNSRWTSSPYNPVKGDKRTIEITCGHFSHISSFQAR